IKALFWPEFRIYNPFWRQCFFDGRIIKATAEIKKCTKVFGELVKQIYIGRKNRFEVAICTFVRFALIEFINKTVIGLIEVQTKLSPKLFSKRNCYSGEHVQVIPIFNIVTEQISF